MWPDADTSMCPCLNIYLCFPLQKQFCEKEEEGIIYFCTFFLLCVQTVSQCSVNVNRVVMCLWGQVFDIMCLEREKEYLFMEFITGAE